MRGSSNKVLGYFYLDSTGGLYAQTLTQTGTLLTAKKLFSGIGNNATVTTLGLVATGAGTTAGSMAYWVEVGGTGAPNTRSLYHADSNVDWTGAELVNKRVGGMSATGAFTVDIDAIVTTSAGEVAFIDTDELGQEVYQVHAYYPPLTPVRDDRWANGWTDVVEPGVSYTGSIDHRHAMVPDDQPAHPYTITGYDLLGRAYPLGSVLQDVFPDGVTGTAEWAEYAHVYDIPVVHDEDGKVIGCFEVRMTSPGVGAGEYVAQRWSWSEGTEAHKEVKYASDGTFHVVYDTATPNKPFGQYSETVWLAMGNTADVPEGTTLLVEYGSEDTDDPMGAGMIEDPESVVQKQFANIRVTMTSDPTRRLTPIVAAGSPLVDSYVYLRDQQAPAFLRPDLSEFPGGAFVLLNGLPRKVSEYDSARIRGRWSNTPLYQPVLQMPGYTIVAYTEEAFTEIEETINDPAGFVVETHDRRIKVAHGEASEEFSFAWVEEEGLRRIEGSKFIGRGEAEVGGPVDVFSVIPVKGLVGLPRIPLPPG
jgi:hypothetical protein